MRSNPKHALGRLGEPDDVASLLAWLVDPQMSWVTGQVYGVDGGLGTVRSR
jgi:NAD(P)-dependent dehydrogenase (short-subunit alcohol dehydrogenase family)